MVLWYSITKRDLKAILSSLSRPLTITVSRESNDKSRMNMPLTLTTSK